MFSKIRNAALALAAIAALGTATLVTSTTPADAMRGGMGSFRGASNHVAMRSSGMRMGNRNIGTRNFGFRKIGHHEGHRHHHNWCRFHGRCHIHVRWNRPWLYGTGVVATSYAVAPAVAAAPRCTCLTKEYTQDGLVVF